MQSEIRDSVREIRDSGREIEIGTFEQSLKEMVQDTPSDDVNNTHELPGDIEIFGIPPPDEKALLKAGGSALKAGSSALLKAGSGSSKKDKSPASPATPSRKGFGLSRGSTMRIAGAPAAADTQPPPPPPVQLGVFKGRIAIRPPAVSAKDMKDDETAVCQPAEAGCCGCIESSGRSVRLQAQQHRENFVPLQVQAQVRQVT